jgi:hypothetical protein
VSWGEINDGNVYAAMKAAGQPFVVSGDGYAASISTAAPLPHVTALAGGGFVVAWDSYRQRAARLLDQRHLLPALRQRRPPLGEVIQANVDSGGGRYDAAVAALSDGSFVVAWQSDRRLRRQRRLRPPLRRGRQRRRPAANSRSTSMRAGDQTGPDVTALAGGGFRRGLGRQRRLAA